MRRLAWIFFVAACGRNDGVKLEISATDVPGGGTVSIVLAEQKVFAVDGQHVSPTDFSGGETVQYLVQQSTGGELKLDTFDGAVLQIEPGDEPGDYVPVLLVLDQGQLVAAGTIVDEHGVPYAVPIRADELVKAPLTLVPLAPITEPGAIGQGHSFAVTCAQADAANGYAWRAPTGPELRLLLAADGAESAVSDPPDLDLDCDGVTADGDDCDDLNAAFHPGAAELCDHMDTNCDRASQITISCGDNQGCATTELCDDASGTVLDVCRPDPTCSCANGSDHCEICTLTVEAHGSEPVAQPCSPSIGLVMLGGECIGESSGMVQAFGDAHWEADLQDPDTQNFVDTFTTTEPIDAVMLRVHHTGSPLTSPDAGAIGGVEVLVTTPDGSIAIPIELFDDPGGVTAGCDASSTDGASTMVCAPVNMPQ